MDKTDDQIIREANEICNKYMPELLRHHGVGRLLETIKREGEQDGCLVQSNRATTSKKHVGRSEKENGAN